MDRMYLLPKYLHLLMHSRSCDDDNEEETVVYKCCRETLEHNWKIEKFESNFTYLNIAAAAAATSVDALSEAKIYCETHSAHNTPLAISTRHTIHTNRIEFDARHNKDSIECIHFRLYRALIMLQYDAAWLWKRRSDARNVQSFTVSISCTHTHT